MQGRIYRISFVSLELNSLATEVYNSSLDFETPLQNFLSMLELNRQAIILHLY